MQTIHKINSIVEKAECLCSFTELNEAMDRMALEMTNKLKDTNPLILCVMTGALIPTGHLLTRLHFPLELDYIHATRYRGTNRGGDLHWLVEPRKSIKDRTVVIIDDILDGGLTLAAIMDYCRQAGAKSIHTAVMVSKKRKREEGINLEADFVGVETDDRYLFGFGLDYNEYLRNVPGIYAIADEDI